MSETKLLVAIENADVQSLRQHLEQDPSLLDSRVAESKLYDAPGFWLYDGDYPLHLAAGLYRIECAKSLIEFGAVVDCVGSKRLSTPLHYAANGYIGSSDWDEDAQSTMIGFLVESGADVDARDRSGATPLHKAVRTRCAKAVGTLLGAGADVAALNDSGSSPLHLAVQNTGRGGTGEAIAKEAQVEIVGALLEFGADPNLLDGKGKTVLERAKPPLRKLFQTG